MPLITQAAILSRRAAAVAGGTTPVTILGSKLVARWNAANAGSITLSGAEVTSWLDEIASIDLAQGTSANRPAYSATSYNSGPGVTFDGTDDYLSTSGAVPGSFPTGAGASEIWVLMDFTAAGSDADQTRDVLSYGAASGALRSLRRSALSSVSRARATDGTTHATEITATLDGRKWVRAYWDGTNEGISVNGGTVVTAALVPATGTTRVRMGNTPNGTTTGAQGVIREALVLNAIASAGEITDLNTYFGALV